jgi:Tfp pilus assembly protein PilF
VQSDQDIHEDRAQEFFEQGEWDQLEQLYRAVLRGDSSDPRTALRLANLLAHRQQYADALELYDAVRAHRWLDAIALNNKGVALSSLGETRAAFQALKEASTSEGDAAPAFFNLGILCEKLGKEGSLPAVLLDLGLGTEAANPESLALSYYRKALALSWPVADLQDRPLLLWTGDLKPGFGFETVREEADVSDAHVIYKEGIELLSERKWREAINKFDAAASLHPSGFAERIKAPKTAAIVEIIREHRAEVRKMWQDGDHEGAILTIDELLALSADLPDRAFAAEIVEAGLQDLARQIGSHKPENGWESLQRLVTAARQRVEALERPAPPAGGNGGPTPPHGAAATATPPESGTASGEPSATPADGPAESAPSTAASADGPAATAPTVETDGHEPSDRTAASQAPITAGGGAAPQAGSHSHIRRVCRTAWNRQIDHLLKTGGVEKAIQLLEFSQVQWFAQEDVADWRRSIYSAKAESLRAQGQDALDRKDSRLASRCWIDGRATALRANDRQLIDSFDTLLDNLSESLPAAERAKLDRERRAADQKEFERVVRQLEDDPGNPRLRDHRESLIRQRLAQVEGALAARLWEKAKAIAAEILAAVPDEREAVELSLAADRGIVEQRIALAEAALERGDYGETESLCQEALRFDRDHARARELQREAQAARSRQAHPAPSLYDQAYGRYRAKRDNEQPEDAIEDLLTLRQIAPSSTQTQEALDWCSQSLVRFLRAELERSPDPAVAAEELSGRLQPLLRILPAYAPALALREELRRAQDPHAEDKRKRSIDKLAEAGQSLRDGKPVEALTALREAQKLRDPNLQDEVHERQEEALALLNDDIDDLVRAGTEESLAGVEPLLRALETWAPDAARRRREEMERSLRNCQTEKDLDRQLKDLNDLAKSHARSPFRALRAVDREVRRLSLAGSEFPTRRAVELRALRWRIRSAVPPLARTTAWIYDRWFATDRPSR